MRPFMSWIAPLDRSPWKALALRLGFTLLFLQAWALRFVPSPLKPEALDPELLALARAQGIDLLDPAQWPSWQVHLLHLFGYMATMAFLWWAMSRLRRLLVRRLGPGPSSFGMMLASGLALGFLAQLGADAVRHGNDLWRDMQGGAPVWGGWLEHPLYAYAGTRLATRFAGLVTLVELLLMALQGRLSLAEARDGALRARLAPHFLYNALNTVHAQIEQDPAGAQESTERLGGLLRQVLEATQTPTVTLAQELAFVEDVLGLERARMGSRLKVELDIQEAALEARLPVLALQVLVENALKHGLEPRVEGGTLRIEARLDGRDLLLAVTDSGDGTSKAPRPHLGTGTGLSTLRERLARPGDLVLEAVPEGFQARLRVPQRGFQGSL